jgi:Ca2+-binding RTX toxin-like protein
MHLFRSLFRPLSRVLLVLVAAQLFVPMTVSAAPAAQTSDITCRGRAATIVYVGYDVAIYGTDGDDVIVVEGGWNRIHGGGGADLICVTGHFNVLEGEEGDDAITASGLHNTLSGGDGDDRLDCDDLRNGMQGGRGADQCNGEACQ